MDKETLKTHNKINVGGSSTIGGRIKIENFLLISKGNVYSEDENDLSIKSEEEKKSHPLSRKQKISNIPFRKNTSLADTISGIGEEYSDLLHSAGISDINQFLSADVKLLYSKLIALNREQQIVRRLPSPQALSRWQDEARRISRKRARRFLERQMSKRRNNTESNL